MFFDIVVEDLGLRRSDIVMVGDSREIDVVGANAAGIRAVWFNPGSDELRNGKLFRTVDVLRLLSTMLES